ncbi:unnamed protein product [Mytilus coruscus]|uniref:Uncharacterized protein n=1 Tax=Mytilus coruscus TaxID=42192 RepID=A0A6J8B5I7_MYTCO|nr:unnamed protein product [Mytilus coruscus]
MSKKTNCFKIHPERESGPCIHCERHNDRTCEMKFKRAFAKLSEENEIGFSSPKKPCPNIDSANESKKPCFLHNFNLCTEKGKDKSGFHGTTIQAVTPCPSLLTSISSAESCGTGLDDSAVPLLVGGISSEASVITLTDIDSSSCEVDLISSAVAFVDKVSTCTELSRDRSSTCDFIQSIVNPDDKLEPPIQPGNQFEI